MVSGPALGIAIAAALLIFGVHEAAVGVKKVAHAIEHVFHHPKPIHPAA